MFSENKSGFSKPNKKLKQPKILNNFLISKQFELFWTNTVQGQFVTSVHKVELPYPSILNVGK